MSLLLLLGLGPSACSSLFGSVHTPTPAVPSPTPAPPTPTAPPLAATVNGEYITLAEFETELAQYVAAQAGLAMTVSDDEASKIVLDDLIAQELLSQGARRAGYELTQGKLRSREQSLSAQLVDAQALSQWKSDHGYTDESFEVTLRRAVEAGWMRDKIITAVATSDEHVHLRQILAYNEADAQAALEQLKSGADFDELAALSDPVTRGELGWVPRGYLLDPNADEAVFALPVGGYSDVIPTQAGFHIFKVIDRALRPLSPDALLRAQELALQTWLEREKAQSEIVLAQ